MATSPKKARKAGNTRSLPTEILVETWDPPVTNIGGRIPQGDQEWFAKNYLWHRLILWNGYILGVVSDVTALGQRTLHCVFVTDTREATTEILYAVRKDGAANFSRNKIGEYRRLFRERLKALSE